MTSTEQPVAAPAADDEAGGPPRPPASRGRDWERWTGIAVFAAALLVGGWLRVRVLDLKPLHSDEGVNGWFLMRLYNGLRDLGNWRVHYAYDPQNYHGPFLYFAGLVPFFTLGPSSTSLRLLMALAGTGCIGVLWAARRWLGWAGLAMAAWLIAVSPPLVYFSRTAIHEIYVVFFSLAAAVCLARCYQGAWRPGAAPFRANWLLFGLISAGLLFTNKETSAITFASFAGAGFIAWFFAAPSREEAAAPDGATTRRDRRRKEKDAGADGAGSEPRPGALAVSLRVAGALVIGLGPALLLLRKVKAQRTFAALPFQQKAWMAGAAVFGLVCAAAWVLSTRRESFRIRPRLERLRAVGRYATGGLIFLGFGPVFLLRWICDSVPFLAGARRRVRHLAERLERALPGPFDELSDYALAYAWAIALVVILFTSFFNNPRGAIDMFATYGTWVGRGHEGAGHDKPFGYWLELLWEMDAPILLMGMLGTVFALLRRDRFGLFVAAWAWSQWLVYSIIRYKTPWLNLNFTLPLAVTGGLVLREIAGQLPAGRLRAPVVLLAPLAALCWPVPAGPVLAPRSAAESPKTVSWWRLTWDVNFVHYDDDRYGIVYVQTVREFESLVDRVSTLLEKHGDKLGVWVTSGDYWPMPFYLRKWDKTVGYYQGVIPGDKTTPSVVVASSTQEPELRERVAGYRRVPFMLRPGVALSLFVEPAVWDPAFGAPPGEAEPDPVPEDPAHLAPGLLGEYRYGIGCTGEVLARRIDPVPSIGGPTPEFRAPLCVSWRGFVQIPDEGEYAFGTRSDDGSWIYVDGKLVLDNGGAHPALEREGQLRSMTPGLHPFELRYFDAGGSAALDAWVRKREGKRRPLQPGDLSHDVRWLEPRDGERASNGP